MIGKIQAVLVRYKNRPPYLGPWKNENLRPGKGSLGGTTPKKPVHMAQKRKGKIDRKPLGQRLGNARLILGMTQGDLARATQGLVSPKTLPKYEAGTILPRVSAFIMLFRALDLGKRPPAALKAFKRFSATTADGLEQGDFVGREEPMPVKPLVYRAMAERDLDPNKASSILNVDYGKSKGTVIFFEKIEPKILDNEPLFF